MRIIDSTRVSMGWNNPRQTRRLDQIKKIGIHHSATTTGSRQAFENHWRGMGWINGGYSEIIHQNGDVEICYVPTVVTNGVGGHNTPTYNICAVGNYRKNGAQPSAAQMRSLLERIRFNMNRFNVPLKKVKGHNEFLGHNFNICPGMRMKDIRNQVSRPTTPVAPQNIRFMNKSVPLRQRASANSTAVKTLPIGQEVRLLGNTSLATGSLGNWTNVQAGNVTGWVREARLSTTRPAGISTHTVRSGETLSGIASQHRTTVAALTSLNNLVNPNAIRVGQVLRLPASNTVSSTPSIPAIRVNGRVRVNANARNWVTGQPIPTWVRGETYTVQQLRNNNNEVLIGRNGLATGWIRRSDVTVV